MIVSHPRVWLHFVKSSVAVLQIAFSSQIVAAQPLLNIDFGIGSVSTKNGPAAIGHSLVDFWNLYSRDDLSGGYRSSGEMLNLAWANGVVSPVNIAVANAPGAWGNGSSDPMFGVYLYPLGGENITVTLTDLPAGTYALYVYAHGALDGENGVVQVVSDTNIWGPLIQSTEPGWNTGAWEAGRQYILFNSIVIGPERQLEITVSPGSTGLAVLNGIQLVQLASPSDYELINVDFSGHQNPSVREKNGAAAVGQTAADFWNLYSRDDGQGGFLSSGGMANLLAADGTPTEIGLSVLNAPGLWIANHPDAMMDSYLYPLADGDIVVTVTNLTEGTYDLYFYSHGLLDGENGDLHVLVGETDHGSRITAVTPDWQDLPWQDGIQYVLFPQLKIPTETVLTITVRPGTTGLPVMNGMQLVRRPACHDPPGLVGWWPGEGNADDLAGSHPGAVVEGVSFVQGKSGLAMSFDGSGAFAQLKQDPEFVFSNVTVAAWIKPEGLVVDGDGQDLIFGQAFGHPQLAARPGANGGLEARFQFMVTETDSPAAVAAEELAIGRFTHVAGTWDGTTLRVYVNGTLSGEHTPEAGPSPSNCPFFIGGFYDACGYAGQFFDGLIDELTVYDRALDQDEVRALYDAGANGIGSRVDFWDVNNGAVVTASSNLKIGSDAADMFGDANGSDLLGATVFSDDEPPGYVHSVEWETPSPVQVGKINIFAAGDGEFLNEREFDRLVIKAKTPGATDFDEVLIDYTPTHPFDFLDQSTFLLISSNVIPTIAREFRAEFTQFTAGRGFDGPRIIELDAFAPPTFALTVDETPGGTVSREPDQNEYVAGTTVTLTALPEVGFEFTRWEGSNTGTEPELTVVMDSAKRITPVFADIAAPEIEIETPTSGVTDIQPFVLSGTVRDNLAVSSVWWEWNGQGPWPLPLIDGQFHIEGLRLFWGENRIRVVARDAAGNEGAAETVVEWVPARVLQVVNPDPRQEGQRIHVPIRLTSSGDVGGASFILRYDPTFLKSPEVEWAAEEGSALNQVNTDLPDQVRATFALPAVAVPSGTQTLAMVSFRARSVPETLTTELGLQLLDISRPTGDAIVSGTAVRPGTATILVRRVVGDNNANHRWDAGDAAIIQRFLAGLEVVRQWDRVGNDVNQNSLLDSGDVIRILRTVVGLDPQPTPQSTAELTQQGLHPLGTEPVGSVRLEADRMRAAPGELVTVRISLANADTPISALSFKAEYAPEALRLLNAQSHRVGETVPATAVAIWNVEPAQNDYALQSGVVWLALSSALPWTPLEGAVAELVFQVQEGEPSRYQWPIRISQVELTSDGYDVASLPSATLYYTARDPLQPQLTPSSGDVTEAGFTFSFPGEAGLNYVVEVSTDLAEWTPIAIRTGADAMITVQDADASGAEQRFYRVRLE